MNPSFDIGTVGREDHGRRWNLELLRRSSLKRGREVDTDGVQSQGRPEPQVSPVPSGPPEPLPRVPWSIGGL